MPKWGCYWVAQRRGDIYYALVGQFQNDLTVLKDIKNDDSLFDSLF